MTTSEYGLGLMLGLNLLGLAYVFGMMRQELVALRGSFVELRKEFHEVVRDGLENRVKQLEVELAALYAKCAAHHGRDESSGGRRGLREVRENG